MVTKDAHQEMASSTRSPTWGTHGQSRGRHMVVNRPSPSRLPLVKLSWIALMGGLLRGSDSPGTEGLSGGAAAARQNAVGGWPPSDGAGSSRSTLQDVAVLPIDRDVVARSVRRATSIVIVKVPETARPFRPCGPEHG
jgi:hypothetical protein